MRYNIPLASKWRALRSREYPERDVPTLHKTSRWLRMRVAIWHSGVQMSDPPGGDHNHIFAREIENYWGQP